MDFATTDLCDDHEARLADGSLRVLTPGWQAFGKRARFAGPAMTLKVFEDNSLVREALESPGQGRVLVVDAGGSARCALVGGNLGQLGEKNGWAGIVLNGYVRDTVELNDCDIGIRALGVHPRKSEKRNSGQRDVALQMPGAVVRPGNWIYVDEDGVLVSDVDLASPVSAKQG
ncbi:ribonuclease E activity regulator RraA [Cupriavidus sp. H18C1]|uniref:ribonuclease E activity regulator RraA n=1 Tax=Cupriavidus sp. H18C1 TaxID=3241601 RepID=UPI003BB8A097